MHAKHIYISILTLAALGAASCSSDSGAPELNADAQELTFQATAETRAAIVTTMNTSFEVYGEYVSTANPAASHIPLFNATPVIFADGKWSYGTPEYWMPGSTYSFVAMYPAGITPGLTNKEYDKDSQQLSFTYTLPADYTQAVDLLSAVHRRQYTLGPTPTTPVSLNFSHLLARLNFIVNVAEIGTTNQTSHVLIKKFALKNISNSATFTVSPAPLGSATETNDYATKSWSNHSEATAALFEYNKEVTVPAGNSFSFFPANGSQALVALPQLLTPDLEIEITFARTINGIVQNDETLYGNLFSMTVANHNGRWDAGQSYTYSFTLGGEEFIMFNNPTVQPWKESEGGSYLIQD